MRDRESLMRLAIRLASLGRHASPNPMVGCVIVSPNGEIVGKGYHPEPGQPHAEVFALRDAGERARGGTAFVTLEPCSHHGRTPPCADALIAAGLAKVVVAMVDPDARVCGNGINRLRAAGMAVEIGLLGTEAARLNAAFIKHRTTGLPYVTVKVATTLDGKIATANGDSKWITSPVTRTWVHRQLRDRNDAIMVGLGTVRADNPSLTTRLTHRKGRNPIRVIVDSHLKTPLNANVISPDGDPTKTIVACVAGANAERRLQFVNMGVTVIECAADGDGRVNIAHLMQLLGNRGDVTSVLVEGGSQLIGSALRAGVVDRYISCVGTKMIGGDQSIGPIGGDPLGDEMRNALIPDRFTLRRNAADVIIDTFLKKD